MAAIPSRRNVADAKAIARLGGPLLVNNLSVTGMSFADTVMAGQLGAVDLAGLAIGAAYYNLFLFIGLGLLMAVAPSVAHAFGGNRDEDVSLYARQSWWLALALSALLILGLLQADWFLPAIGITPEILPVAMGYVHAMAWGLPAIMAFFALRFASEGMGNTKPIMYIAFLGLLLNVCLNWLFMYGKFGMPRLGAVGCGVATSLTQWLMFAALLAYTKLHAPYRPYRFFRGLEGPDTKVIGELLKLGLPIAGSILAEGGLFVSAALIMGVMGATTAGAHQIALNFAAFTFMIPLSISSATTIHVGHTLGRGERRAARAAGFTGIGMCLGVMAVCAFCIFLWNQQIAALYTTDTAVRALAAQLLLLAAIFQISDGVQVGTMGALRGFKDTAIPMVLCVFSYWIVGFSLAYVTGVTYQGGPVYVWIGLIVGLTINALLLVVRYVLHTRQSALSLTIANV